VLIWKKAAEERQKRSVRFRRVHTMKNARRIAAFLSMGMAFSAVSGGNVFAADKAFQLDVANWDDQDWNSIAMTNDDTVTSGVIIRADASSDSEAIGYLYRGAAVNIVSKDDTWTKIQSGSVTGYVMNDYLVSGDMAKGLADYYGKEGVVANWNDVNVFSDKTASRVSRTVDDGTAFPLVSDEGHWLLVQQGADQAGYVSEDDASRMLLVDTAVPVEGEDEESSYMQNLGGTTADTAAADYSEEAAADYSEEAAADYSEEAAADYSEEAAADYSEEAAADYSEEAAADYSEEAAADYSEEAAADYSEEAAADYSEEATADYSEEAAADYSDETQPAETYQTQTVSDNADVQALYDAYIEAQNAAMNCTSAEDAETKAAAAVEAYNAYVSAANGTSSASADATAPASDTDTETRQAETAAPETEAPQPETTAAPETEAPQPETTAETAAPETEAQQAEGTQASSGSTGSYADYSDLDLLAAIIWCEAGNQPYDGMVAVGEVVMNRVASPSFPNTIAEVLEQPGQFTPYSSGTLQSALASGVNSNCYSAAQDALNGAQPVPGALYFNTHSGSTKLGDHYFS